MIYSGYSHTTGKATSENTLLLSLNLPDGTTKELIFNQKISVGEVKRGFLKGTPYNYDEYHLKIDNNNFVLKDEAVQFRRAETFIVKSLLKGEAITLSLANNGLRVRKSPPDKIPIHSPEKQLSTTQEAQPPVRPPSPQPLARPPSPQPSGFERRVTVSAADKQKSPRNQADLIPPKRMITIGSRQITKTSHSADDIDTSNRSHLLYTSPRYVSSADIRSVGKSDSPGNLSTKSIQSRLFEDTSEIPSRNACIVFPVKIQLFNRQWIFFNCSSSYSVGVFVDHIRSKLFKIYKDNTFEEGSAVKFELAVDGNILPSDECVAKSKFIIDQNAKSSIPTLQLLLEGKPLTNRVPTRAKHIRIDKNREFQMLFVLPTGQTVVNKCNLQNPLFTLKQRAILKANEVRGVDLIPERYLFASWNEGVIPKLPVSISTGIANRLTIFKDEAITLQSIPYIQGCLKRSITPKLVLVRKQNYTFSESENERSVAVKALIGRPLLINDEDDEIITLRRTMAKIRTINRKVKLNNFKAQSRVSVRIVKHETPKTNIDLFVVLVLPLNEVKKTVTVKDTELADEFLAKIFTKYYQKKVPEKKPSDFVLKAAGLAEYIDGHFPLNTFEYVRSRVAKNLKIELVVVDRPSNRLDDDSFSVKAKETNVVTDDLSEDTTIRYLDTEVSSVSKEWDEMSCISLWDMERTFRVKIVGIENISLYYNNLAKLLKGEGLEDGRLSYYVTASLYHGGKLLSPALSSHGVTMSINPRWYQTLTFAIKMKDLPRAARLCFTLYARTPRGERDNTKDTSSVPIGWVNCQLFNFKHELKTGLISLNLYRDEKANPIGTCVPNAISNAATLYIEFDTYNLPVVFPTEAAELSEEAMYSWTPDPSLLETPANAEELDALINKDTLYPYTDAQRDIIWHNRYYFLKKPKSLPKILASANEADRTQVIEMKRILNLCVPLSAIDALELLDSRFADSKIRGHAVEWIDVLPDEELLDYLLQLVQVLKYEPYHDSALARFLIRRSLWSSRVGHAFFWYLKSEMHVQEISERFGLLLEAYLFGAGQYSIELKKQDDLMNKLMVAANCIKPLKDGDRREVLLEQLRKIEITSKISLPLNPSLEVNGIMVDSCKYMDSKKLPLWVVLNNADTNGLPIYIIFKSGDDLRQDMLTLQMIRIMDKLWKKEGLDLQMSPYGCISTGDDVGMIEVVLDADTTASISKKAGGATAAFYVDPLKNWLQKHNPTEAQYEKAVESFIKSCAGYCVATYVLGIGDRHNDNIMVTKSGRLFHIDFGHFLGNYKKKFGIKRERAPFVLTPDFAFVMGGEGSPNFKKFIDYCCTSYNILRRHSNKFINLFAMMLSTGIPELTCVEDINYLRNAFTLESTDEEASNYFTKLIYESLSTKTTQFNNAIHILAH